jgi:hypothetical protein
MEGDARAYNLVQDAERLLVRQKYEAAEVQARDALDRITHHLPDAEVRRALADRAAVVLLQALYETDRFSSARPCLVKTFGGLENSPPLALLLWLSLGLDTAERDQVHHVTLSLLRDPSIPRRSGWTRRQYLALIHLYVIEILLPALKDPSEVIFWLDRQRFLPLDPRERRYLEEEVRACTQNQDGNPKSKLFPSMSLGEKSPPEALHGFKVPHDASQLYNEDGETSETGFAGFAGFVGGADLGLSPVASRTARRSVDSQGLAPIHGMNSRAKNFQRESGVAHEGKALDTYRDAKAEEELELDWLGKWQAAAFSGAAAAASEVSRFFSSSYQASKNEGHISQSDQGWQKKASVGMAIAAMLAVGGMFSVAAYQERDFVKNTTVKVARGVARGLMDLGSMATSVSLN